MTPPGAGGGEAGGQPLEAFSYPYLTARLFLFLLQTFSWARELVTTPPHHALIPPPNSTAAVTSENQ